MTDTVMAEEKQITFSDPSELDDSKTEEDLDEIEDEKVKEEHGRAYSICSIPGQIH